jgi:3-hydroxyisobutyrate dehydrogenase-like beta-hydroxyacid dehydrogenase
MGAAIARSLVRGGVRVLTTSNGRSAGSAERAAKSGADVRPSLADVVGSADIFLSVVPSDQVHDLMRAVMSCDVKSRAAPLLYVDCNAITPRQARELAQQVEAGGGDFVDASIIGPPPGVGVPRLYVSGKRTTELHLFDGMDMRVCDLGVECGRASALKLVFAGLNKGFNALSAAMLIAAERLGVGDCFEAEVADARPDFSARMVSQVPYLPVNAARWSVEMREVAELMREAGMPDGFHDAASGVFDLIAKAYGSSERRENFDRTRKPRDVARTCAMEVP